MSDLPTLEQRWSIASLSLEKHGMDVRKIAPLLQAVMLRQLEADEIIGAGDDEWRDWVDAELEAHPSWALPRWFRLKHARDLINNWHQGWGDPGSDPEPEELAEHKYALLSWYNGNSLVRSAGDTMENVLETICMIQYSEENPEYVESFIDLDTGEWQRLSNKTDEPSLKTTITLSYGDHTYTHHFS
jgi:hypothetical protein